MAATALMGQDLVVPAEENDLDREDEGELAYFARLTDPNLASEPEEPYLAAREAWVLLKLTREMYRSLTDEQGLVAPETNFSLGDNQRIRRPDLAFVSAERWPIDEPAPADETYWQLVPDLAVEIVSPSDLVADLMAKIEQYFAAGVRLVWTVHPAFRKVYVYQSPKAVVILDQDDTLDGGAVVAGFAMPLRTIFPAPRPTATPPQP